MGGSGSSRWVGFRRGRQIHECASVRIESGHRVLAEIPRERSTCMMVTRFHHGREEQLAAVAIRQPFGGRRWYFVCPRCRRRCRALYVPFATHALACRLCHRLTHESQRLNRYWRLNRRLDKLWHRMGGDEDDHSEWPEKPKGMHWRTFERLKSEWSGVNDEIWADAARTLGPFLARLSR